MMDKDLQVLRTQPKGGSPIADLAEFLDGVLAAAHVVVRHVRLVLHLRRARI